MGVDPKIAEKWMVQLCSGVESLHNRNIILFKILENGENIGEYFSENIEEIYPDSIPEMLDIMKIKHPNLMEIYDVMDDGINCNCLCEFVFGIA